MLAKATHISTAPNQILAHVLDKYFRVKPAIPADIYLHHLRNKPNSFRQRIARLCRFPQIVNALAEDLDPEVREQARQNEYWQLVGQFKILLKLTKEDKIRFVERESFPNLLIFLIFEEDPDVLEQVFMNPNVSISMLNSLSHYLEIRGIGPQDESILGLVKEAIQIKKKRIYKITSILKAVELNNPDKSIPNLLEYLLDKDDLIIQSAVNALKQFAYEDFLKILNKNDPLGRNAENNELLLWHILQKLQRYYHLPRPGNLVQELPRIWQTPNSQDFSEKIHQRKIQLLNQCAMDLSRREKFLTIVYAHLDPDPLIQEKVNSVLNLEEILALVGDDTFPQALGKETIKILKNHPSRRLQRKLDDMFVQLSERMRRKLKEMETTINAYFDIIFNSLGYPQMLQTRQAIKTLSLARDLILHFFHQNQIGVNDQSRRFVLLLQHIRSFYYQKLKETFQNISNKNIRELEDVYQMIIRLLRMPEELIVEEGYDPQKNGVDYANQLQKVRLMWRSSIGQYLGRLKELDKMIQTKWRVVSKSEITLSEFQKELHCAIQMLEQNYKARINCRLNLVCKVCKKRNCAAERLLHQIEFLMSEFLDFIHCNKIIEGIK